ncbi:carbon-nitrogen hydrolase family protein [Phenylobacterium sp.]|uniref:carbon-nitrogen hydrolase family protein n=1 Tax=Phenylobacterium sp. TaxID=1871053 RepID=UPI0027274318|nr:carbon-nitrogen hydrolase family protein [Phenylobacterium sp.]MDO8799264.1 carbon-nitrogen hydrolase family protein [Phenylobacterium sp.]
MTFRLAVAQSLVGLDQHANAAAVRDLMRQARAAGADLAHFPEGAVSGYPSGPGKPHFKGWSVDWEGLRRELEDIAKLAAELELWVVVGANHRLSGETRPHNSLYVISPQGELAGRYDKRLISGSELADFYTPGRDPLVFEAGGFRFGLALCIEVNFPELFLEYGALGADVVLFSTYSEDPIFGVMAQAYAAATNCWVSLSAPAQFSRVLSSGVIGPHGYWLSQARRDGQPALAITDLDRADPALDMALNKARPWRAKARTGDIYGARNLDDRRSRDQSRF